MTRTAHRDASSPDRGSDRPQRESNITPGHVRAFQMVTSQAYDITMCSCRINGEQGVAIVMLDHVGEGKIAVMPLFVAITPNMDIAFDGEQEGGGGSEGGPSRYDALREFQAPTPGGPT